MTEKPMWKQAAYALRFPDRAAARIKVENAVAAGRIVSAKQLLCVDCLNPAREYDHHLGYSEEHVFDVQPVCRSCHVEREKRRRPFCKRGHKYTDRDWREVNGRKVHWCHECEKIRQQPGFTPVDGRGPRRGDAPHRGEKHGSAKLTDDIVHEIRATRGATPRNEMAAKYGVSRGAIDSVLDGKTWRHVSESRSVGR